MGEELTLEELNRRLAAIQDRLLELADDDFAEKFQLQKERDRLRDLAGRFAQDRDARRSTEELVAELEARRSALEAFRKQMTEGAKFASAGLTPGAWEGPADSTAINEAMKGAHDVEELMRRIAELEEVLVSRGEL